MFVTNLLPDSRARLKLDVDDVRAVNPDIIYARATGQGARGPDHERGRVRPHRVLVPLRHRTCDVNDG